ncbi:PIN domain-containing protein [Chitinophaga filiformis]|uniref:PIN domain-containing protein n=1 Tax=Chitinophaga filiformis TaxID=104663 RepID=A0ABY4I3X8_CHIFI|nr:PIN domain-containing protein [Chitinophaga filiformis]UPK70074.1 PIN domain-containing protein [Chitinophaga filiformis]
MGHIEKPVAVLDANVLYAVSLCDFLLHLAESDLFIPKWSKSISDEWIRNLLANRPDLKASQLKKRHLAMEHAFPDANVTDYKSLITHLKLPDEDDRHVLAAAIKSKANLIITFNEKDFPPRYIGQYKIAIENPDDFICRLLNVDQPQVLQAFLTQVRSLGNPPRSVEQILTSLKKCGLTKSTAIIRDALKEMH